MNDHHLEYLTELYLLSQKDSVEASVSYSEKKDELVEDLLSSGYSRHQIETVESCLDDEEVVVLAELMDYKDELEDF